MPTDYEALRQENLTEYGQGTRHLAFLDELYDDRTHFIFELLQNAEDAGASEIRFDLFPDRLEVRNNGRLFSERDVRAICSIGDGTKKNDGSTIGKFGIGFKSVYAYTRCPQIHSGDEHFQIQHYVRPEAIPAVPVEPPWTTLFVFPLEHPELAAGYAFQQIGERLMSLDPRLLLFLRRLQWMEWSVAGLGEGRYLRHTNVARLGKGQRITVIAEVQGVRNEQDKEEEEWLLFHRSLPNRLATGPRGIEIAFRLQVESETGRSKIVPASYTNLVVYFPTAVPTNLGFLLQGPYDTTPSRDNIRRDSPHNQRLIAETADFLVEVLHDLRDRRLLQVPVLETLPIDPTAFPPGHIFRPLYDRVHDALKREALLPAADGSYVSARNAKLPRGAATVELISPQQLTQLFQHAVPLRWLSTEITEDRTSQLYRYIAGRRTQAERLSIRRGELMLTDDGFEPLADEIVVELETIARRLTEEFLQSQPDSWLIKLYTMLGSPRGYSQFAAIARSRPIIRLEDGDHVVPNPLNVRKIYLPPAAPTTLPIVRRTIAEDAHAFAYLKSLGIKEPNAVSDLAEHVLRKYEADEPAVDPVAHREDTKAVLYALAHATPAERHDLVTHHLPKLRFLRAINTATGDGAYRKPSEVFVRDPDLMHYLEGYSEAWVIAAEDEPLAVYLQLRKDVVSRKRADEHGYVIERDLHGEHARGVNGFDPSARAIGLDYAVKHIDARKAQYIWNTVLGPNADVIQGTIEESTKKDFAGAKRWERYSLLGAAVLNNAWLPDRTGAFHRPQDLSSSDLSPGFTPNPRLESALRMRPSELASAAQVLGVSPEDAALMHEYRDEVRELLQDLRRRRKEMQARPAQDLNYAQELQRRFDLPGHEEIVDQRSEPGAVRNPERRREGAVRVVAENRAAEPAPEERFKQVERRVLEGKDAAVRDFLLAQYNGRCQICQWTFPKRNGEPYFEAVYLVPHSEARWLNTPGNVLCVCANCCARLQNGAVSVNPRINEQVQALLLTNEGGDGRLQVHLRLTGRDETITFSERHLLELQAILREEGNDHGALAAAG